MNELAKCFWEKCRGEIEGILETKKGSDGKRSRDRHPPAVQHLWSPHNQSDWLTAYSWKAGAELASKTEVSRGLSRPLRRKLVNLTSGQISRSLKKFLKNANARASGSDILIY